ncbi:MAG: CubicO group peptidase (beta-lactamase class C family) [Planctomycetota bacterium]|jgi:CubicO group peptidase (beta-lactamase class C family)
MRRLNLSVTLLPIVCALCLPLPIHAQEKGPAKPPSAPSQATELEDLAALLAPIRKSNDMPALGAAVIVDGKLVALGVDGIRKVGDEAKVTTDDLWHLGSCTKAMTATLLAKQVAAGKLKWHTTLGEALPDLREGMHEDAAKITIASLLQHRSGLPSQPPMAQWMELFKFDGTDTEARREVAANMLKKVPEAALGQRFLYSNAGYMIAGAALERATGKTWQELMKAELFTPLGMNRVGFGAPGRDKHVDQPWGHVKAARASQPMFADNPSSLGPAGTVHATLEDWAKFVALHLGVVPAKGEPLLAAPLLADLHRAPKAADYALGWVTTKRGWAPGPIIWHNGSNTMWFAVTWMAPDAKFAVLVTCNHGGGAKACDEAAAACIQRFRR